MTEFPVPVHRTILVVDVDSSPSRHSRQKMTDVDNLIARSSFGTAAAVSLAGRTPPNVVESILWQLRQPDETVPAGSGPAPATSQIRAQRRQVLYGLLEQSLLAAGVADAVRDPMVDRGDGLLALIQPVDTVPKTLLLSAVVPTLTQLLAQHNDAVPHPGPRLRLRVAVHAGEVHFDGLGFFGESIDLACRLVDAPETKRALADGHQDLALVVSDDIYRSVVRQGYDGIDSGAFSPAVRVRLGGVHHRGWVGQATGAPAHGYSSAMPSVIVVHHRRSWREAIARRLIERGFNVVTTTEDPLSARRIARSTRPDAELVDLNRAELSGDVRNVKILILSTRDDRGEVIENASLDASEVLQEISMRSGCAVLAKDHR
jgi:class 3 adenylate cyclase